MQVLEQLMNVVRDVANTEIMPRFMRVGASRKDDGSLCTEADLASQQALMHALPVILPCPVLGEEMTRDEQSALWDNNPEQLWVVDPLDGTTNFVNGLPHFAVSVALVKHGRSEMGVIYNPVSGEMFYAERGRGAYLNATRLPLRNTPKIISETIAGVDIKYLRSGRLASRISSVAPFGTQRNLGSCTLDWCYLACGRFDLYVHGGQRLWDYAAGAVILEEAGGRVVTLQSDDYWSDGLWKRSVVAAGDPVLFEQWRRWVRANQ